MIRENWDFTICMARENLLIFGWLFPSLRPLLKYLIFICYFISCWKKLSKKNCFHFSRKFTTCLTISKKSTNKASRAKNWGAGICCVTVPSPTLIKLQFVSPLIFLRALRVLRFFPHQRAWSQAIKRSWRNSHNRLRIISIQVARIWYPLCP